jgi:uncharacterized membrane protein YhaH (DUF805 family)
MSEDVFFIAAAWVVIALVFTVIPTTLIYTRTTFDRPFKAWKIALCVIAGIVLMPVMLPLIFLSALLGD